MAEPPEAAAGPGSAAPPSPRAPGGPDGERCPGGARPEPGGAAADPEPGAKVAGAEPFLKPPAGPKHRGTPGASARKRPLGTPRLRLSPLRSSPRRKGSSPQQEQSLNSFSLSPLVATPQGKRRSWCRSSLKGSKRRKSLPPCTRTSRAKQIHQPGLPESERLSCSSSPVSSLPPEARAGAEAEEGFSPRGFCCQGAGGSAELGRLGWQKAEPDGTLRDCVEDPEGNSLDSALDEPVAQVEQHMARFSSERQAWDQLLQQHQDSAQEAARLLETLRANPAGPPLALPSSQSAVLGSKPDYSHLLLDQGPVLRSVELALDELCQAGALLTAFSEESRRCLRGLSERLGSRTFRQLENSPLCRLLAAPPDG
ncbi:LOW QUALITY PROTEIN: kinetochore-associated protein DSN1 homolog [Chiroxiphia lanceolata]|uniref:LOW QUALITY PROTEIN: kinetochore-associated protein DSN1 homolog n=1 Tax=Chiroxiphia lanceolata TaxID=296741 RepID=UPI0013CE6F0F|nr:LOW QUALITY PROTEIN: kinetochore-associated protein DSN1 homolog [Chiroxiphia lanceolata]